MMCACREELVFISKVAEQAERFDEMYDYMKKVVNLGVELSKEERSLFTSACKKSIEPRKNACRTLSLLESQTDSKIGRRPKLLLDYKAQIIAELLLRYNEVLGLLDLRLLPNAVSADSRVLFLKMTADYHRYLLEISWSEPHKDASVQAYEKAFIIAHNELKPANPLRLGLAINYAVFLMEVMKTPRTACKLVKEAFDKACEGLGEVEGEEYEETTAIMQVFRDSLTLWNMLEEDKGADFNNDL